VGKYCRLLIAKWEEAKKRGTDVETPEFIYNLAKAYLNLGREKEAEGMFQKFEHIENSVQSDLEFDDVKLWNKIREKIPDLEEIKVEKKKQKLGVVITKNVPRTEIPISSEANISDDKIIPLKEFFSKSRRSSSSIKKLVLAAACMVLAIYSFNTIIVKEPVAFHKFSDILLRCKNWEQASISIKKDVSGSNRVKISTANDVLHTIPFDVIKEEVKQQYTTITLQDPDGKIIKENYEIQWIDRDGYFDGVVYFPIKATSMNPGEYTIKIIDSKDNQVKLVYTIEIVDKDNIALN